jgi:hypothetical protein
MEGLQQTGKIRRIIQEEQGNKVMRGKHIRQLISEKHTGVCQPGRGVRGWEIAESGSEFSAAVHQGLHTKCHATKLLQTVTDSKCRLCQESAEAVERIVSACPVLVKLCNYYKTFNTGNNVTFSVNCYSRMAAALYGVEIWFVSGR